MHFLLYLAFIGKKNILNTSNNLDERSLRIYVCSLMHMTEEKKEHIVLKEHQKLLMHQNSKTDDYIITDQTPLATSIRFDFELLPISYSESYIQY